LAKGGEAKDCGSVTVDGSQKVIGFNEKDSAVNSGLVNAGIYIFTKRVFDLIPPTEKLSLEYDIFPKLLGERFYGYITERELIDIGTPERYTKAKRIFK
jgi:NDP-sugar pyrophosphorylase family protein